MTDTIQLIQKLIEYLEDEEQRHYEECYDVEDAGKIEAIDLRDDHIYTTIRRLKDRFMIGDCWCGGKTGQEAHTNPDGLGDTESIICRKCGAITQVTIGEMTPEEANAIIGG